MRNSCSIHVKKHELSRITHELFMNLYKLFIFIYLQRYSFLYDNRSLLAEKLCSESLVPLTSLQILLNSKS
jgi:hypothetical protein